MSFERLDGKFGNRADVNGQRERGRMGTAMRNTDLNSLDAYALRLLASRATEANDGTPGFLVLHFHVQPTDAVPPTGSKRL